MKSLATETRTRYYCGRRWKITWRTITNRSNHAVRVVKCYERRGGVGMPWTFVRGVAMGEL